MSGAAAAGVDPSMEDILASIRRILSDDVPTAAPRQQDDGLDVLVLDSAMLVDEAPRPGPTGMGRSAPPPPPPMLVPLGDLPDDLMPAITTRAEITTLAETPRPEASWADATWAEETPAEASLPEASVVADGARFEAAPMESEAVAAPIDETLAEPVPIDSALTEAMPADATMIAASPIEAAPIEAAPVEPARIDAATWAERARAEAALAQAVWAVPGYPAPGAAQLASAAEFPPPAAPRATMQPMPVETPASAFAAFETELSHPSAAMPPDVMARTEPAMAATAIPALPASFVAQAEPSIAAGTPFIPEPARFTAEPPATRIDTPASNYASPGQAFPILVPVPRPPAAVTPPPAEPDPIPTMTPSQSESSSMSASFSTNGTSNGSSNGAAHGLASAETAAAAAGSVGNLLRALTADRGPQVFNGGPTIADLVRDEMRPMLANWLDANLPPLVERMVRVEIERVLARATA